MCGGLKITKVSFGRTSAAGLLFFLVPGGHEFFRSLQHPLVPRRPIVHLAARVHTALSSPNVSRLSTVEPSVASNAGKSSLRQSIQFCSWRPLPGSSPSTSVPSISRFGRRPAGLSGHGSREQKSPLSNGSFHALAPSLLEGLSVRKLSVGAALTVVPDNSQE